MGPADEVRPPLAATRYTSSGHPDRLGPSRLLWILRLMELPPPMAERPTLYVLDAYSLIFQVFHAIPSMTGPTGQPTNAVFGVFRDLLNLRKSRKPDYLAAAFDGAGPVFREKIYADYKANRSEMPADLVPQVDVIRRVYEAFRVPVLIEPGFEADDVIATLARAAEARGLDVLICTSDKDARQLISDRVRIYNVRKNQVLDAEGLMADWGIGPEQVVDWLSLTGDAVDNVPGVPGIGPKTATELLQKFGDLDTLLKRTTEVSGKKRQENLREHAETARRARRLVELRTDLPLALDWEALKLRNHDAQALKAICFECGFHGFLNEIVDDSQPPEAGWDLARYAILDTPSKLEGLVALLKGRQAFSLDTETTSVDPLRADLVGLSFAWGEGEAGYVPVRGPEGSNLIPEESVLEALAPVLRDPEIEKIGQNIKYDLLVLRRAGADVLGPITDTMVLSYLLEPGERNHGLDELSRRLLDHTMVPIESLIGKGKNQRRMDQVDVAAVAEYAAEDADAAWRLAAVLRPKLQREKLWGLYADLERPLLRVLAEMERTGIRVDVPKLQSLSREFAARLEVIQAAIHNEAGRAFNISSPPQLRQVLFDELKLPSIKKTPKGEPSTDAEVLEELATRHPLPRLIVEHRQLEKLKNTYLDTLPGLVHEDGRVHSSFSQVVAATGRLSSSDPNLQNIPVRTEEGQQIRQAFIPGPDDWVLLTADYSQIELRVLAHFSKDPTLLRAFNLGKDIHAVVAARIFGVTEEKVTPAQRRMAKTVNFGVIYGLSGYGLAARLGIERAEADAFIEEYFRQYPGVTAFITRALEQAKANGRVETILGRRRNVTGVKNTDRMRSQPERVAVNAVIQGSAADLIKKAMIDLDARLKTTNNPARLLLQIHDELVLEAPRENIAELAELVRETMTGAIPFDVPIEVDIAAGPNWLDVRPIEEPFRLSAP